VGSRAAAGRTYSIRRIVCSLSCPARAHLNQQFKIEPLFRLDRNPSSFRLPGEELLWCVLGIALIGAINLAVSFSLALWTALKSRGIDSDPFLEILQALWRKFLDEPLAFFRIPR
jgi:hypothetical protein